MKKIGIVLLTLLMFGCSANPAELEDVLMQSLYPQVQNSMACIADNHKPLFSYYASPSVGRRESTETSNVFLIDGVEVVMNLDISTVMNSKYYPDAFSIKKKTDDEIVYLNGKYRDCKGKEYEYVLSVYLLNNGKYYVDFQTHFVNFYATVDYVLIDEIVVQMMKISQTVEVNETAVITYYSSKPSDEHEREKVELFQEQIAENGRLDELIGIEDSGSFEEDEPEIEDPIEDMPDNWIDELVPEEE